MNPEKLFCAIRSTWVAALPEELIRQQLIQRMTQELEYPLSGFALEKSLSQMPHLALTQAKLPARRADLVFFAKGIHPLYDLYPFILIECKATPLISKVLRQVIGYNFYVKSPFIAIVNQAEVRLGWYEKNTQDFVFISEIPSYQNLLIKWEEIKKT